MTTDATIRPCERCHTTTATGTCCTTHGKKLCHGCYRRTNFVDICVIGCRECIAERLPIGRDMVDDRGDEVSANIAGLTVGVAWGPAADGTGEWFVMPTGTEAYRVADKPAAVEALRGLPAVEPAVAGKA